MNNINDQFIRKCSLLIRTDADQFIDLSQFRIKFQTINTDYESPNSLTVRVYNLSDQTVNKIKTAISKSSLEWQQIVTASQQPDAAQNVNPNTYYDIVLNAGYENGNFGVIFQGNVKQFKVGRENNKDNYLDFYVADGDFGFINGVINETLAAGSTIKDQAKKLADSMPGIDIDGFSAKPAIDQQHTPLLRGKTLAGMSRAYLRNLASKINVSWSIENGKILMIPIKSYRLGEAVIINVNTGLIGLPEQTDNGISLTILLNSALRIGGLVKLNNKEIPELTQSNPNQPLKFDSLDQVQANSLLSSDGIYRVYSVEHIGDTRGQDWYSKIVCLSVDPSAITEESVKP